MFDNPLVQLIAGLGVFVGGILVTLLGSRNKSGKLPPYLQRVNDELTEPVESFDDLVNRKVSKATEEFANRIIHLERRLQNQATDFGKQESELEERIEKLENSLNQANERLTEKDKALDESRSVNSIMADNASKMSERMTKIETQMDELRKKYNEKVEALGEREKLISELETQLKIQQVSIDLLKDFGSKPVVIHLITGDHETTHFTDSNKVDTAEVSETEKENKGG